jgi:hypothetical protein
LMMTAAQMTFQTMTWPGQCHTGLLHLPRQLSSHPRICYIFNDLCVEIFSKKFVCLWCRESAGCSDAYATQLMMLTMISSPANESQRGRYQQMFQRFVTFVKHMIQNSVNSDHMLPSFALRIHM